MEINIQRINELARKAKAEGLTPAEKEEQQKLRREYIAAVKMNLRTQLDNIDMQEKDGTIVNLGSAMEAKGNIRKEVFARRRAATQEEIQEKSRMIYEKSRLCRSFWMRTAFLRIWTSKEVMTRDLIEKALQMGKTVAVPRVEDDDMVYYEIKDFSTLKSGYFGIMEPDGGKVCTREEGFLLVPGVAFDPARHRVGYGKGFYDRFLAAHPGFTTVAAAFEFQLFDAVPFEETDVLPQMLVTEQKIYR